MQNDQVLTPEQFMAGDPAPAQAPAQPAAPTHTANSYTPDQYHEYVRLVRDRNTTPAQLSDWMEGQGIGRPSNAEDLLRFNRRNPNATIPNIWVGRQVPPPAPAVPTDEHGIPQPGTPTDWLPDFIQGPIEHLGLKMGLIDPSTYYGPGDYGPNAVRPNAPQTVGNTPLPSWTDRVARRMHETFRDSGGGINAFMMRSNEDVAADQAIRDFGSNHNWTSQQIDDALHREQTDRGRRIAEDRQLQEVRDNDEVRREDNLGVNDQGQANSSWGGTIRRGSANLVGGILGDANPTYAVAPAMRPVAALAERAAPAVAGLVERILPSLAARGAAPLVERAVTAAAPAVGRAVGQGAVQGGSDLGIQTDEVSHGIRDHVDLGETALHTFLGFALQGGLESLSSTARALFNHFSGRTDLNSLLEAGMDPADLPPGVTPAQAASALREMSNLRTEAQNYRASHEPTATDVFPTAESRAADAERWGQSLGAPEPAAVSPEQAAPAPVAEPAPTATRADADALFNKEKPQTDAEWTKNLQASANDFVRDQGAPPEPQAQGQTALARGEAPASQSAPTSEPQNGSQVDTKPTPFSLSPAEQVVDRMTEALNNAGKATTEQQAIYAAARRARVARLMAVRGNSSGEAGLQQELAQLKGEMPRAEFEPVRPQFSQDEITTLFDHIRDHPNLSPFESVRARVALARMLDGKAPTPSEMGLMSQVFPSDFMKAVARQRATGAKISEFITNAVNLPRTLMSSIDLSAPGRQGVFLVGSKAFWKNIPDMVRMFGSERTYNAIRQSIRDRPTYDLMQDSGLAITNIGAHADREEAFMSQWVDKIPGIRASERAYTGYLNKLRADTFDRLVNLHRSAGINLEFEPTVLRDIARFVNSATGRGDLGGKLGQAGPMLNGLFFSPRLMKSRVDMLNPVNYITYSPIVRREAIKSLLSFGGITTTVIGLAAAAGLNVGTDPRSSDFGKIITGNTRYDILGGFSQYLTFATRMVTNESTSATSGVTHTMGEGYGTPTRLDAANRFVDSKFSPVPSFVADYLRGSDSTGQPFQMTSAIASRFTPMFLQDLASVVSDRGAAGVPMAVPSVFGVGVNTYTPTPNRTGFMGGTPAPVGVTESATDAKPATADLEAPAEITADQFMQGNAPASSEQAPPPAHEPTQTTFENSIASGVLRTMGLRITDNGIRSHERQQHYYETTHGAAPPGHSDHEIGNAIDIGIPDRVSVQDITSRLEEAGFRGVNIITRRHGTGPHWHISWQGVE